MFFKRVFFFVLVSFPPFSANSGAVIKKKGGGGGRKEGNIPNKTEKPLFLRQKKISLGIGRGVKEAETPTWLFLNQFGAFSAFGAFFFSPEMSEKIYALRHKAFCFYFFLWGGKHYYVLCGLF